MKPIWPEILRVTLVGTAQGLLLAAFAVGVLRAPPQEFIVACGGASNFLLVGGDCVSFFDTGRPRRAAFAAVLAPLDFFLLGTASGFTLAVPLAVFTFPPFTGVLALAAFSVSAVAYLVRCASLLWNARRRPTPAAIALAVRWAFLVLVFPPPAWLLGWGGGSVEAYMAAFVLQFAGLLAERWHEGVINLASHATR